MKRSFLRKASVLTLAAMISQAQTYYAVQAEGIQAQGINAQGINAQGINTQGINKQGINAQGINTQGINKQGINAQGINTQGINKQGINAQGINTQGINKQGINAQGINTQGMNTGGINATGINPQGIQTGGIKNGEPQAPSKPGQGAKPKEESKPSNPPSDTKPKAETKPKDQPKPDAGSKDKTPPPASKDQGKSGKKLGSLSAAYESNGNPGTISTGKGDIGGKSYGAYQFNSRDRVIDHFFRWLEGKDKDIYNKLLSGFNADGKKIGAHFDQKFKEIAEQDPDRFLELQHLYTKEKYYDVVDRALKQDLGFDVSKRSAALQDVLWSRAVQHGGAGGTRIFKEALKTLDLSTATDEEIIRAVYKESGKVVDSGKKQILSPKAKKHGIYGKYMKYFSGNSSDVQLGVWERLNIREPEAALKMLYGPDYVFKGL